MNKIILGDCLNIIKDLDFENIIIVSDPPFNIGYKYNNYKDNLKKEEYYKMIKEVFKDRKSVIVHYPEQMHEISIQFGYAPLRSISWVYNSNTPKQHREIAFYNVVPNMKQVIQPYKNLKDKRIMNRIANGILGGKLYDWWNINQVKNVNKDKTSHPCQMPLEVMKNIIGVLPKGSIILDPFMGSGTTCVACKELGYDFIGIEKDEYYFNISKNRIENTEAIE